MRARNPEQVASFIVWSDKGEHQGWAIRWDSQKWLAIRQAGNPDFKTLVEGGGFKTIGDGFFRNRRNAKAAVRKAWSAKP
jgi:hypothetical protein